MGHSEECMRPRSLAPPMPCFVHVKRNRAVSHIGICNLPSVQVDNVAVSATRSPSALLVHYDHTEEERNENRTFE